MKDIEVSWKESCSVPKMVRSIAPSAKTVSVYEAESKISEFTAYVLYNNL